MSFGVVKKTAMIYKSVNEVKGTIALNIGNAMCQVIRMRYRSLSTLTHTKEPQGILLNYKRAGHRIFIILPGQICKKLLTLYSGQPCTSN